MIPRKIEQRLEAFYKSDNKKALLITGARQVGKTYIIRELGKKYKSFIEINFLENPNARVLFENATDSTDLLLRLSALTTTPLIKGETLIFLDEVQECKEIVTAIKFLVEEGSYRYVLSGSLLGVDLKDIRSVPVGYMDIVEMYPLDFEEFIRANGVSDMIINALRKAFDNKTEVDNIVHEKLMELFRLYLIVGGMPKAVSDYISCGKNITMFRREIHQELRLAYLSDMTKYVSSPYETEKITQVYQSIPRQLAKENPKFK